MHFGAVKEEAGVSGHIGLSVGFFLCHMLVILSTTHFFPIEEDFFCSEKIWYKYEGKPLGMGMGSSTRLVYVHIYSNEQPQVCNFRWNCKLEIHPIS